MYLTCRVIYDNQLYREKKNNRRMRFSIMETLLINFFKSMHKNLVVPMKWPMDSSSHNLTNSLASLTLRDGYQVYPTRNYK